MGSAEFAGGPPCKQCGKGIPPPEKIAEWMELVIAKSFKGVPQGGIDISGGDRGSAIWVMGSIHAHLLPWAAMLRGVCGDCSYEEAGKRGEVEEFFHVFAASLWAKHFPTEEDARRSKAAEVAP